MLRAVTAVALAAAILGVTLPAVDTVRTTHADDRVRAALDRLAGVASQLQAGNDAAPGAGARRHLRLHLPRRTWAVAGLERLRIRPVGSGALARWRVTGGTSHRQHLPDLPLRARGGLIVRDGGIQTVVLVLRRTNNGTRVGLRRGFKSEAGTTPAHAGTG